MLYELHVGSFTARHPDVPPPYRGTYLGLAADPPCVDHLVRLGVTAVELLPVQAYSDRGHRCARGACATTGATRRRRSSPRTRGTRACPAQEVAEFRTMVDACTRAGIEVILDVVYNHTCEQWVDGPTLSAAAASTHPATTCSTADGRDIDLTGCGNTVDACVARRRCG